MLAYFACSLALIWFNDIQSTVNRMIEWQDSIIFVLYLFCSDLSVVIYIPKC